MIIFSQFSRVTKLLIDRGVTPLPDSLPAFDDPHMVFAQVAIDTAVGGLRGNWMVLIVSVLPLIVNVVGEEFWCRGLIFPRQQLAFGVWVWVVRGVLWTFFHGYKCWDKFSLLPISLGLSFAVYLLRNSTPALMIHFVTNGAGQGVAGFTGASRIVHGHGAAVPLRFESKRVGHPILSTH